MGYGDTLSPAYVDNSLYGAAKNGTTGYIAVAGTWTAGADATANCGAMLKNTSEALNDELGFGPFYLPGSNNLKFKLTYKGDTASAIVTVYLDGVSIGTIDLYKTPATQDLAASLALGTITTGLHSIRVKATGKSGSSYRINVLGVGVGY